jgi:hypothetical protein
MTLRVDQCTETEDKADDGGDKAANRTLHDFTKRAAGFVNHDPIGLILGELSLNSSDLRHAGL